MSEPRRNVEARPRYIDVNNVTLYCEEYGSGDSLLLLHGGLGSGRDWELLIPSLVDDFHLVTIDVRGHGRSTNPSGTLTYPLIASDLALAIEALGLERPFIAGWSDGGQHALQLGCRYPELVRAVMAGAADFKTSPASKTWVREFFGMNDEGEVDLAVLDEMLGPSAPRFHAKHSGGDAQWSDLARQTAHLWLNYEGLSADDYHRIVAPVLVMVGDRDDDVSVEDAVSMFRAIPHAELAVCPNASHSIPWQRPSWLVSAMRAFLDRQRHQSDDAR